MPLRFALELLQFEDTVVIQISKKTKLWNTWKGQDSGNHDAEISEIQKATVC